MHYQSDICIIGNGTIGKSTALGFAQAGASVTLLDASVVPDAATAVARTRVASTDWDLRVYALNPLAQALLARLMVWGALDLSRVTPVDAMTVYGDDAGQGARLGFDAYSARVGTLAWIVEDANLNQALDSALKFAANVRRVSARADALTTGAGAGVVALADGGSVRAELIIGADGPQSWVRAQAGIDIDYRPYGQHAVVASFVTEKPHRGIARQWFSANQGIIALLPLAGNQVSLVWSAPDALAEVLIAENPDALARRVSVFCADTLGMLAPLGSGRNRAFPLNMIRPHAITAAGMALVGDAAHVVHPLAGQGMNLGFADVDALLRAVDARAAHCGRGDARVLSRYARERREEILLMQVTTDCLQRLFATDFEPVRIARNIGMNLIDSLPTLKRRLVAHAMGRRQTTSQGLE